MVAVAPCLRTEVLGFAVRPVTAGSRQFQQ